MNEMTRMGRKDPVVAVAVNATHASRGCGGGTRRASRSRSSIGVIPQFGAALRVGGREPVDEPSVG